MKLIADILELPLRRILFVLSLPIAVSAYFLGLYPFWCIVLVPAITVCPVWILHDLLHRVAKRRLRLATPSYRQAHDYEEKGEYLSALAEYNKALAIDSYNSSGLNDRGRIHVRLEEYDLAISDFTVSIGLSTKLRGLAYAIPDPDRGYRDLANAYYERSRCYLAQGKYDLAYADLNDCISLNSDLHLTLTVPVGEVCNDLGLAYHAEGQLDEAIACFGLAIRSSTSRYVLRKYHDNRHRVYWEKGDQESARVDMMASLRLPTETEQLIEEAEHHRHAEEFDEAISACTLAISIDPTDPEPYYERGDIYLENEEFDLAIADFSQAISLDSDDHELYLARAGTYMEVQEFHLAISDLTKVVELWPSADAYRFRAKAYRAIEQHEKARADIEIADQFMQRNTVSDGPK